MSLKAVVRALIILGATAAVLWLALAVTLTLTLGVQRPEAALALWPVGAKSEAALAARLSQEHRSHDSLARARALAERALQREPVNVAASRTLGILAAIRGDQAGAQRLFRYSEALSRRDIPTQLWLIEQQVTRNDIAGALRHYDRALRTSYSARDLLIPILVQAAGDPAIGTPLARMLSQRPPWWIPFTDYLLNQGTSAPALAALVASLRLDPAKDDERTRLLRALDRLVSAGAYRPAFAVYRAAMRSPAGAAPLIRDGDFEGPGVLPPFDWSLVEESDLAAIRETRDGAGNGNVLSLAADNGRNGPVARQLLVLRPGGYRFAARFGDVAGGAQVRPLVAVKCAGSDAPLLEIRLPVAPPQGHPLAEEFAVPAHGCEGQWLTISATSGFDGSSSRSWVDSLSLQPR